MKPIITLMGKTNSGKSSLMNALLRQTLSIVSEQRGTTTDPVVKTMEWLGIGPVLFVDTAGLEDYGVLGKERQQRTMRELDRSSLVLLLIDATDPDERLYRECLDLIRKRETPHLEVISRIDLVSSSKRQELEERFPQAVAISAKKAQSIELLRHTIEQRLKEQPEENTFVGDLLHPGDKAILVTPIDSEAPKGRLILPQVQVLRDCLDHGVITLVVQPNELQQTLEQISDIAWVITDSQAFKEVDAIVNGRYPLTSFSILLARQKGNFNTLVEGAKKIASLPQDARILIVENCTHNTTHEDIGQVKLPNLLRQKVSPTLSFEFCQGRDFPEDLSPYDLVIHCGGCMINRSLMRQRVLQSRHQEIPITNYGMALAALQGILERATTHLIQI